MQTHLKILFGEMKRPYSIGTMLVMLTTSWLYHRTRRPRTIYPPYSKLKALPLIVLFIAARIYNRFMRVRWMIYKHLAGNYLSSATIDEKSFPNIDRFRQILHQVGAKGPRLPGGETHDRLITWIHEELVKIGGLQLKTTPITLLRWKPRNDLSLQDIAGLQVGGKAVPVAGAVPYSKPTSGQSGDLVYYPPGVPLDSSVGGKVVLLDFPARIIPYVRGRIPSYSSTADLDVDLLNCYDRPGFADHPLHSTLLAAGRFKAAGVIFMFDLPTEQIASYFDPHQGTHYSIPALYVGGAESQYLRDLTARNIGASAQLRIDAEVLPGTSHNLIATLPGQIKDRIVYVTHTDGNTYIQENGSVAMLTLARYFAALPLTCRRHTIEFAFNSGHLHISKEGTHDHANAIDAVYDKHPDVALIIPMEHLGAREIEAVPRRDGLGRELRFSGRGEIMFWCAGPMPLVIEAIEAAISRRHLDRVLVTRGVSPPDSTTIPTFTSFGGIGTSYHNKLLPTASLISGPWSLWAPSFGMEAVDVVRLRNQTLALGDVLLAIDTLDASVLMGGYAEYRQRKLKGAKLFEHPMPRELPDHG